MDWRWPVSSFFNWLFTDTSKTQTPAEAQANIANQQAQLQAQTQAQIAAGTLDPNSQHAQQNEALYSTNQYIDPGQAASDTFLSSIGSGGGTSNSGGNTPGIGSVLTDVFVIGAIGAGIWAFFEFGGVNFLKSLAAKSKWWVVGIVGAVALLAWWIYSEAQKTASDASSTWQGITAGLSALNPFSSSSSSTSS